MDKNFDVLVVGAGTAGILFATKMVEQGYSVMVFDKLPEEKQGSRLGVFHTDKEHFERYGLAEPLPGDEDYVGIFEYGITKSAFGNYPKKAEYPFLVLKFAPFLKRLRNHAKSKGVLFSFDSEFIDFYYVEDIIEGAYFLISGQKTLFKSRLVADCSGIPSVARRKLVNSRCETFEISPREMFYVILHYSKLKNPQKDIVTYPTGFAYYKSWYAPGEEEGTMVLGTGANLSFEYAELCHKRFRDIIPVPEHEYTHSEYGFTPYRRPPYSLVDNGFICMGDTACMTKPFSGEGISAGWIGCAIAAEVAGKAMQNGGIPSEAKLWEYNRRYAMSQGADFANLMAMLVNAVDCTPEENDYEFKKDIVFTSEQLTRTNRYFKGEMTIPETIILVFKVLWGVITGNISIKTVANLLKGVMYGGKLKSHYRKYPETLEGFSKWEKKANVLWEKTGNMADVVEKIEAQNAKKQS